MQQQRNNVADPSQVFTSGQDDYPSVLLHSSKLRNKLEKLAQWRIDPSLIEFPQNAPEFFGGFAKVSQGLLASSPRAEEGVNKSEQTADEHLSPDDAKSRFEKDHQEPGDNQRDKGDEADGLTADADIAETSGEGRSDNDEEQVPHGQGSILRIGNGSGTFGHIVGGEGEDLDDRNPQSKRDTQGPHSQGQQGRDGGTDLQQADHESDQTKDVVRTVSANPNEQHHSDHQSSKPKMVAVKRLNIAEDTDLERVLGLALRESELLTQLSHPNIVKLEGFVEDLPGYELWLIFPWEEHGNLRDFLASGEWEIPERISLINDVTLGLEYLHSRDPPIYHGDLKSLNILVNSKCRAVITDFGSARCLRDDHVHPIIKPKETEDKPRPATDPTTSEPHLTLEAFFSATASTITLTGSSYTLRWAAPEVLLDDKPCLRSDIWALGWIAYEVMTNTIPFHDVKKDAIVIDRVIQGHMPSVTEDARMSLIRALCSLMVQCWNLNPEKRPTAAECRKLISWMPMIVPAPTQDMNEGVSSTRYAQLLNQLGQMYKQQGDYLNAYDCFTKASDIYTIRADSSGKAYNLRSLADLHLFRGEPTEAASFYTEALQIYTRSGDQMEKANAIWGLAEVRRLQGEYEVARGLYLECLDIYSDTGNTERQLRANALFGLASVHLLHDEYSAAQTLFSEALEIFTNLGDRQAEANVVFSLAEVHRFRKEYTEATQLHSQALETFTDIGDRQGRGTALWGLAKVHRKRGEYNEATRLFSEAADIFTDVGDKYWRADALICLARSHEMQAHNTEAISLFTEASNVLEDLGDPARAANARKDAADIRRTLEESFVASAKSTNVAEGPLLNSE
ncbi:hypothetical protein FS837_008186 [Tulasnella sp. UAMH 9824]|nr:hypothetical protein FS837_008186 [Tulasnella sp. UAMH 9824]